MKLELRTFYPPWQNYRRSGIASPSILFTPFTPRSFQCENTLSKLMLDISTGIQVLNGLLKLAGRLLVGSRKPPPIVSRLRPQTVSESTPNELRCGALTRSGLVPHHERFYFPAFVCVTTYGKLCFLARPFECKSWDGGTKKHVKYCKVMSCIDKHQCIHDRTCHIMSYHEILYSLQIPSMSFGHEGDEPQAGMLKYPPQN